MNLKNIHIGNLINQKVAECGIEIDRICNFMKCSEREITKMYEAENLETNIILKWSKLLEYDFFRIYSQHLILYAPQSKKNDRKEEKNKSLVPSFKKNIYTRDIIEFILKLIITGEKTKQQVITEYRIPKTTLYKWIKKYQK